MSRSRPHLVVLARRRHGRYEGCYSSIRMKPVVALLALASGVALSVGANAQTEPRAWTGGTVVRGSERVGPPPGVGGGFPAPGGGGYLSRYRAAQATPPPSPSRATWRFFLRNSTPADERAAYLLESEGPIYREVARDWALADSRLARSAPPDERDRLLDGRVALLRSRLGEAAFVSLASYVQKTYEADMEREIASGATNQGGRAPQELSFPPLPSVTYLDPAFRLEARASSGLRVYFTASGDCSLSGSTVRILSAGSCFVTAQHPGNERYAPAPDVVQVLRIRKADQWIIVPDLPFELPFGSGTLVVGMRASSGLDVVVRADGCCTADGASIRFAGVGTCLITGHQPGSANYAAAPIVEHVVTVVKGEQTIQLPDLGERSHGPDDVPFVPVASSGLSVYISTAGPCVFTGEALRVTGTGACAITAEQPGNENYHPAPKAFVTVNVARPESTW